MAALHDFEVKPADVLIARVNVPNREKTWTELGLEFGDNAGKSVIIVQVLHSLKKEDASFRAHLAECMWKLGYWSCDADPNLCIKAEYRPEDKLEYYPYILHYVDDILCTHHYPDDVLNKLNG